MTNKKRNRIDAFTIFEVTVVLAIMSVLIGIISFSLNRFNEQLHNSSKISAEMNEFRAIRSEIWREFYFADSITEKNGELSIYMKDQTAVYKIADGRLYRSTGNDWKDLNLEMEAIHSEPREDATVYHLDILWKGDVMHMDYHFQHGIDKKINEYFKRLND